MKLTPLLQRVAGLLLLAAAAAVPAQTLKRSYVVLSELAQNVSVVTVQDPAVTGGGPTAPARLAIPEGTLDKVVLLIAKQAIAKADPEAPVWLVAPLDTDLFGPQQNLGERATVKLPADLADEMQKRGSTHLLFITRFRGEARLPLRGVQHGRGTLEGMGFYVDRFTTLPPGDAGPESPGFLAPFIYARAVLIDARTGLVLRTRRVGEGKVIANPQSTPPGDPWNLLSPTEKVGVLNDLIVDELGGLLPTMLER